MACPCRDPECGLADIRWPLCPRCDRHHHEDRECPESVILAEARRIYGFDKSDEERAEWIRRRHVRRNPS